MELLMKDNGKMECLMALEKLYIEIIKRLEYLKITNL